MNTNNPRCDVHMYPKIKCNFLIFVTTFFGGPSVFSPMHEMSFQMPLHFPIG